MDKIVALCKNRGFIFAGSEIYGGLANTWDYGPLGVELKNNVKKAWWKKFVQENKYNVGLDAAILMNPQTWIASGHLAGFSDPLMDCRECHERFRADKLIEDWLQENPIEGVVVEAMTNDDMVDFIAQQNATEDNTCRMICYCDGDIRVLIENFRYLSGARTLPFLTNYMDIQRYFEIKNGLPKSKQRFLSPSEYRA